MLKIKIFVETYIEYYYNKDLIKKGVKMTQLNIQRYKFNQAKTLVPDVLGDFVLRLHHEKHVFDTALKSELENIHIPEPLPYVINKKSENGYSILDPKSENVARLIHLLTTYQEHSYIIEYIRTQLEQKGSSIKRYNLYRFKANDFRLMEDYKGKWIKHEDHHHIVDKLYETFDFLNVRFIPNLDTYGLVTTGDNSWYMGRLHLDELADNESSSTWGLYEQHEGIIGTIHNNLNI